jgi:glycosyltransferase involved in cell wall biosynthesis
MLAGEVVNSIAAVKRLLSNWRMDVVLVHQSLPGLGPSVAGQFTGTPLIYFFHSPWHEEYLVKRQDDKQISSLKDRLAAGLMRQIEGTMVRRADRVCVISEYMKRKAVRIHGLCEKTVAVVPAGVDTAKFCLPGGGREDVQKRLKLPRNRTLFFTARNLVPRMGLEHLVRAFSLGNRLRKKALLLVAGSGPLAGRLRRLIRSESLEDTVQLLGYVSEDHLIQLYQAADFFVLPTAALEGFGLVILEAMACGTPVVGTNVGAIPEVISAFDPRLVVPAGGAPAIRQCLETIVSNPDLFDYDPSVCRKFVTDRYSWDKTAASFEKVAQSLMASHPYGL